MRINTILLVVFGWVVLCTACFRPTGYKGTKTHAAIRQHLKQKEYKQALDVCKEALSANQSDEYALGSMVNIYEQTGNREYLLSTFDQLLAFYPQKMRYRFNKAYCLMDNEQHLAAIDMFRQCIANNYSKACSYNNIGTSYEALNNDAEALSAYDSCLQIDPVHHNFVLIAKSNICMKYKKIPQAIDLLDVCIQNDPQQLQGIAHRMGLNSNRPSTFLLKILLKENAKNVKQLNMIDAYTQKAKLYLKLGKLNNAFVELERKRGVEYKMFYNDLYKAQAFTLSGDYAQAMIYCDKAQSETDSAHSAELAITRGTILYNMGRYAEALKIASALSIKKKDDKILYFAKGLVYLQMHNLPPAIQALEQASVEVDDKSQLPEIFNALGYAYFLNKQYREALQCYEKAIEEANDNLYQPYFDYKKEATLALNNRTDSFCTVVELLTPFGNANYLLDSSKFHFSYQDKYAVNGGQLAVNCRITTNEPFVKENLLVLLNDTPVKETPINVATIASNKALGRYQYNYSFSVKLPKGQQTFRVAYNQKTSQTIRLVVQ